MSKKIAIAYIPVLHKGYLTFLEALKVQGITELYLIGDCILEAHDELDYLNRKDRLRALPIQVVQDALSAITTLRVCELTDEKIQEIQNTAVTISTPREDIGRVVVEAYFADTEVTYIDIFLRWNRDNTGEAKAVEAHRTISLSEFQKEVFAAVLSEAENAVDWWRQVGAALVKDNEILFVTHNEHMPEKEQPAIIGDTRALFKRGINVNYVTSAHAEVVAIAEAAKRGIATKGAELYLTDFPCPYCARLIAKAGIKKLYFMRGYAVLAGDEFLKEEAVEVIRVTAP